MGVNEVVPFLSVSSMSRSLAYYVDGLGFEVEMEWRPEGEVRWCELRLGRAHLMLQVNDEPSPRWGQGVGLYFMCDDALASYRAFASRGIEAREPFVGNRMWVTSLTDPDGYHLHFESPTDAPEETRLSEVEEP